MLLDNYSWVVEWYNATLLTWISLVRSQPQELNDWDNTNALERH